MEEQAQTLLSALKRSSVPVEAKVQQFNTLKSSIKHLRVPDAAQAAIFECVRITIASSSPQLVALGFSTLGHLCKRLVLQDQGPALAAQGVRMLPVFLERLGDAREAHRTAAAGALADLWPLSREKVENVVRDSALAGGNPRAKETAVRWLVRMHAVDGFLLRSFVPHLVACLEDADGVVREVAKSAVVDLFSNASEKAKSDVKKQMAAHNVRKATVQHITVQLEGSRPTTFETSTADLKASTMSLPATTSHHHHENSRSNDGFNDSVMSEIPPPSEAVPMDPLYMHSQRDLEDAFRDMHPHFEGRESEHNWIPRDKSVTKLRRLTSGNAPTDFHAAFLLGVKSLIDGINKVANSLRTTMSTNGCLLVQELAKTLGTGFDPMADFFIPGFIKMSGATKHIAQQNGNDTVDIIFANTSYHMRSMQQIWSAYQEKNISIRTCAPGWLKTLIRKHGSKSHFEAAIELVEKSLRKGLADANPKVKEGSRSAYWTYAQCWPSHAEPFMAALEPRTQQFVNKDPANLNSSLASSQSSAAAGDGNRPLTAASGRASMRETIMAQRRAMKAANLERPTSAASVLSPSVRDGSATSLRGTVSTANIRQKSALQGTTKQPPSSSSASANSAGGLMSAPLRRPRKPDVPRPATADPYARGNRNARIANQTTPSDSPSGSPSKSSAVKRSPVKAVETPASRIPVSPPRSKARTERLAASDRRRPPSAEPPMKSASAKGNSATAVHEDSAPQSAGGHLRKRAGMDKTMSVDRGAAAFANNPDDDEGFTMVIPDLKAANYAVSRTSPSKIASPKASPQTTVPMRSSPIKTPLARTARSPLPERQLFPSKDDNSRDDDDVKVYEDPFTAADTPQKRATSPDKPVLEELPLNERNVEREHRLPSEESDLGAYDPNIGLEPSPVRSPGKNGNVEISQDRAEILRSRRLLSSGIERVRACTLDGHGFRRLQDLVKHSSEDVWYSDSGLGDGSGSPSRAQNKFAELMSALLSYLSTPLDPARFPSAKAQTLKTQALATVRAMLALWKKEGERFVPGVLCAVVTAHGEWEGSSHIGSELERAADDMVGLLNSSTKVADGIEGLLGVMEDPDSFESLPRDNAGRMSTAALTALARLLAAAGKTALDLPPTQVQRLGALAVRFLGDSHSDVRRADMEVCLELHARLGGSGASDGSGEQGGLFWKVFRDSGLRPEQQNLITYYLARRARA